MHWEIALARLEESVAYDTRGAKGLGMRAAARAISTVVLALGVVLMSGRAWAVGHRGGQVTLSWDVAGASAHVSGQLNPDGSGHIGGFVVIPGEKAEQRLQAVPDSASWRSDDLDGDQTVGLAGLDLDFRDPRSGEIVHGSFTPLTRDIDQSGRYKLMMTVGDFTTTIDVEASWRPTPPADPPVAIR